MNGINKELIALLLSKTKQKLISWSRGSSVNEYRTDLNAASISISNGTDHLSFVEYIRLSMYNGTGSAITLAYLENNDIDYESLEKLYLAAKDSCTKESETIDLLLKELNGLGNN